MSPRRWALNHSSVIAARVRPLADVAADLTGSENDMVGHRPAPAPEATRPVAELVELMGDST